MKTQIIKIRRNGERFWVISTIDENGKRLKTAIVDNDCIVNDLKHGDTIELDNNEEILQIFEESN